MTAEKGPSITLRLQRLYESVTAAIEEDARADFQHATPSSTLMMDVAQDYSSILGDAASLAVVPDSSVVIYEALRVASCLLAFESHGVRGTSAATETVAAFIAYALEGIERLVTLLPSNEDLPLPKPSREKLIAVVCLLLYPAAQQQSEPDRAASSNSHPSSGGDAVAGVSRPQHAWRDRRLLCARLLTECGLPRCRDMEELLSSSCVYGSLLQQFLLQTLQREFTMMRRHASGLLTALNGITDEFADEAGTSGSGGCDEKRFYYYAILSASSGGVPTRPARSGSTASSFSTGCNTPRSRHTSDDSAWQLRGGKRRSSTTQRLVCQGSAAVLWSLAALASLGAGEARHEEAAPQELYDQTSDFVDFVGDLVSVCAVVVRPFLTEQLELMRQLRQDTFHASLHSQALRGLLLCINEDVARYCQWKAVVEQFLSRWDPAFARASPPRTAANGAPLVSPRGAQESREKRQAEQVLLQGNLVLGTGLENNTEPRWEPVVPALAAHLALPIPDDSELAVPEVVSLFTEVKHFREGEREALWTHWTRLRRNTMTLAAEVARMQHRLNFLLESKVMLSSLSAAPRQAFECEWEKRISQRLRDLQQALRRAQQRQGEQPQRGSQTSQVHQ
ncbi:uncharacterized protein Tco025E_07712 [Trypanosoma conorhini]|uniref:Uncharacterized protein n=1 Tax=Trypanosoma conorhini TaxID=83891 RepID=A0A3R7KDD5_9TRYP|nr:uncharacterized protein Tco025E_07712 [Trypanosoma conorhini]RNF05819.1 hypothetical protein Tco025E_07712 [Trypanosoma conorhini]